LSPFLTATDGTVEAAKADVVHFAYQAGFLTAIPSIYQPHDLQHLHLPEFFTAEQIARREATYRAYCEQARLVVTPSGWVKQDVVDQYGLDPRRIAVVNEPPVIDAYPEPTAAEIEAISRRLELPDRFVFYPAQTWPHKNHARLFEALRTLRDEGVTVPLVCTGLVNASGAGLQELAVELGIGDEVKFLGYIAPVELKAVYAQAAALVFPSLYEGWGLPVVEAFSAGLPVACSNVTSLPELVDGAALLFDPLDPQAIAVAIRRIWENEALADDLARRGRAIAAKYDWQRTALIMRSHYRQVAGVALSDEDRALVSTTA
jgi:glycosyltransferase involved in cell wall biosynthesis